MSGDKSGPKGFTHVLAECALRKKAKEEPSDEEVEAAAKAMMVLDVLAPDGWDDASEQAHDEYRSMARAALTAARKAGTP